MALLSQVLQVVGKKNLESATGAGKCGLLTYLGLVTPSSSSSSSSSVIFVGNHSNQFLDAGVLVATAGRPVSFLVAAVSMKVPSSLPRRLYFAPLPFLSSVSLGFSLQRPFIGQAARTLRSIAVTRSQVKTDSLFRRKDRETVGRRHQKERQTNMHANIQTVMVIVCRTWPRQERGRSVGAQTLSWLWEPTHSSRSNWRSETRSRCQNLSFYHLLIFLSKYLDFI